MSSTKKLYELIHLADRAMTTCHYNRAEKLFRQLMLEAFRTKDNKIIYEVSKAYIVCRQLHALDVLRILKRIDPLQAQRKDLS